MKQAIIVSVGDELVLGQTVDTNSAWLSQQLAAIGCAVKAHITVADDQRAIEDVLRESAGRCDYLIVTGGLGPTEDDLTRQALAAVMNVPLEMNESWLKELDEYFIKRGRSMPEANKIQAMIPRGAALIWNTCGTAAGIDAQIQGLRARGSDSPPSSPELRTINPSIVPCRIFVMPGVPKEMKAMFERDVRPHLETESRGAVILSRTLHTFGLGESAIAQMLGPIMMRARNPSVGTTVSQGIVSLRINSRFESRERAQAELDGAERECRERLGDLIFGADEETLQVSVARLLAASRKTVATAESCTGGLLSKMLTDVPGSSEYFQTGFVTYANQAKYDRLGVSMEIINIYGAVSEPVVSAMAKNARRLARSDFALAISGVAGPGGGTPNKPVGTVCIALASDPDSPPAARTFHFPGDREWIRDRAAKMALSMLRFHLLGKPMPF